MLYSDPMLHPRWIFAAAVVLVLLCVSLVQGDPYAGYTAGDAKSLSRMPYETAKSLANLAFAVNRELEPDRAVVLVLFC